MINLQLIRSKDTPNSTPGGFWHDNKFICFTIEDGFHFPKIKGITRIPVGRYQLQKATDTRFNAGYKSQFGHNWVMRVLSVPNFEGIEIHIGNRVENTDGCILLNSLLNYDKSKDEFFGEGSITAYRKFYEYIDGLNDDQIYLTITQPTKD